MHDDTGLKKKQQVRKSNSFNQARFRLSLNAYRLLIFCITKIQPMTKDVSSEFRIYGQEYAEMYGLSLSNAYKQIRDGLDETWDQDFYERLPSGKNKEPSWRRKRFVITQSYQPNEGYGSLELHPDFLEHLIDLRREYTEYTVRHLNSLRSFNFVRMYELLIQFRKTGQRYFEVQWFREVMGLEDNYPRWTDLRKHVIYPALKQISQTTDIEVQKTEKEEWAVITKRGNRVIGFEVIFRHKAQQTLDLDPPDQSSHEKSSDPSSTTSGHQGSEDPSATNGLMLDHELQWQTKGFASAGEYDEAIKLARHFKVPIHDPSVYLMYRKRYYQEKAQEKA